MRTCDICGGEVPESMRGDTCPDCLGAIIANSMADDLADEDGDPILLECDNCGEEFTIDEMVGTRCSDCNDLALAAEAIEPVELADDDLVTSDYIKFYRHGFQHKGPAVECRKGERWAHAVEAYCDKEKFWPNVWFIGERGDVDLIDMFEALHSEDDS